MIFFQVGLLTACQVWKLCSCFGFITLLPKALPVTFWSLFSLYYKKLLLNAYYLERSNGNIKEISCYTWLWHHHSATGLKSTTVHRSSGYSCSKVIKTCQSYSISRGRPWTSLVIIPEPLKQAGGYQPPASSPAMLCLLEWSARQELTVGLNEVQMLSQWLIG